jgi:hypothetical protein
MESRTRRAKEQGISIYELANARKYYEKKKCDPDLKNKIKRIQDNRVWSVYNENNDAS